MSNYLDRISLSGIVYPLVDSSAIHSLENYYTTAQTDNAISSATSSYADSVKFNNTSKYVEFYHGGIGGTKVFEYDASPFLIDGMVSNVEIKSVTSGSSTVTCLVISFNTDAGKQDINIPISDIFDANNYYTKTDVDSAITQAVSGKADTSSVYTKSETSGATEIATALNGKQDTLTAGTNITIVDNVISASGASALPTVSGNTLVFS
jgi:hypothetical protein